MSTWLRWLLPDLLTMRLNSLSVEQTHWVARKLNIFEGLHDFMHGFCPCSAYDDPEDNLVA